MTLTRKTCNHPGCTELQCISNSNYKGTGKVKYRLWCYTHYMERKAKNAGFETPTEYQRDRLTTLAKKNKFESITDYKNSKHKYLKYRKTFCENIDGRLGFVCTCNIVLNAQLQVDHIDGNPENNDPANLQTLCANCHIVKTIMNGDSKTPGRKMLKQKSSYSNNEDVFNFANNW